MRAKSAILIILGLFLVGTAITARASDQIDFLIKGVSARPGAMGQAFVAVTDNTDSVYWNPASLALVEVVSAGTVHSSLNDYDMSTDMLSFAWPIEQRESGIGLSVFRSSISNNEIVDAVNGRPVVRGFFDERETAFLAGYGFKAAKDLWLGATVKYMSLKFYGFSASGAGLDLGLLYAASDRVNLGLNLQNVIPVDMGDDKVPFNAKFGVAYKSIDDRLILAADVDSDVLGDSIFHLGAEFWLVPQLALRLGSNDGNITAGVGLSRLASGWNFDYAYDDSDVGDTHRVSVRFDFAQRQPKPQPIKQPKKVQEKVVEPVKAEAPAPAPAPKAEPKPEPKPAPKPEVKPEPAPAPAPAPAPEPKVEPKPAPVPEVKPEPAPEPVKEEKVSLIDAYSFFEGDDVVSLSYTDLKTGQSVTVYRNKKKVAEVKITDVGMLSSTGKISKLHVDKLSDYLIGDQIGVK